MTTLYRAYTSTHDAEDAIERLLSARVPASRIELIRGRALEDARDVPIGTFAGTTTAGAVTVGSYAKGRALRPGGDRHLRRRPGHAAPRRVQRHRSRHRHDLPVGREANAHRVASRGEKLLVDGGLDRPIARANVRSLHAGRVLVLVSSESALDDIDRDRRADPARCCVIEPEPIGGYAPMRA
jgi:hypothetical protein